MQPGTYRVYITGRSVDEIVLYLNVIKDYLNVMSSGGKIRNNQTTYLDMSLKEHTSYENGRLKVVLINFCHFKTKK